jgi:hypothetical protein
MDIKAPPITSQGMLAPTAHPGALPSTAPAIDDDPVEAWVKENPTFDDSKHPEYNNVPDDLDTSSETTPTTDKPAADVKAEKPAETTTEKPVVEAKKSDDGEKPANVKPVEAKVDDAKPAVEAKPKPTYGAEEKFALAEGVEWSRAQIIEGLKERNALKPLADEAKGWSEVFRMPFVEAKANWTPILEQIAKIPGAPDFIESYLFGDPAKAEWLATVASQHYDAEVARQGGTPAPAAKPQTAAIDPSLKKQIDELAAFRDRQVKRESEERVQAEWTQVTQKYPILLERDDLRQELMAAAYMMYQQDNSKGLLDAAAVRGPMYDLAKIAGQQAPLTPTPPAVPAMLGSSGAAPGGSTPEASVGEKTFSDTNDAVDDWLNDPPKKFK